MSDLIGSEIPQHGFLAAILLCILVPAVFTGLRVANGVIRRDMQFPDTGKHYVELSGLRKPAFEVHN